MRRPATVLTAAVARRLKLSSPAELVAWVYGQASPQERFATLLPVVQEAVEQEDPVAMEILEEAAGHLATAARAVFEQLDLSGVEPVPLIAAGGAFRGCPSLVDAFERQASIPLAAVRPLEVEPALGAVYLAMSGLEDLTS